MRTDAMSMRTAAKILGVSHAYLSQIKNGKRPLPEAMKERLGALGAYHLLTTSGGRSGTIGSWRLLSGGLQPGHEAPAEMVGVPGFEPGASCSQSRRATVLRHTPLVESYQRIVGNCFMRY